MRFLTSEWARGELSDEASKAAEVAHGIHRVATLPFLPAAARRFAESVDIHDGLIRHVALDRRKRSLRIGLRCGDVARGYSDLDISYTGVWLNTLDIPLLKLIARNRKAEALFLETDCLEADCFAHRWLWYPFYRNLDVHFTDFAFTQRARRSRRFERRTPVFKETGKRAR